MTILGDVQQLWQERWRDQESVKPHCHNRPEFRPMVQSTEFPGLLFKYRMSMECQHWKEGGNAYVRKWCDSAGGRKTPWSSCNGCRWKP